MIREDSIKKFNVKIQLSHDGKNFLTQAKCHRSSNLNSEIPAT